MSNLRLHLECCCQRQADEFVVDNTLGLEIYPLMQITFCSAVERDAQDIAKFDEFGGERPKEILAGLCFVAKNGEMVVGYSSYEPRGILGQPLLTYLCVRPEFRRQKIATSLVLRVQETAKGRVLVSSTEEWCVGTQKIFEDLGWRRIGQLAEINKDGSNEIFYAISLSA